MVDWQMRRCDDALPVARPVHEVAKLIAGCRYPDPDAHEEPPPCVLVFRAAIVCLSVRRNPMHNRGIPDPDVMQ